MKRIRIYNKYFCRVERSLYTKAISFLGVSLVVATNPREIFLLTHLFSIRNKKRFVKIWLFGLYIEIKK